MTDSDEVKLLPCDGAVVKLARKALCDEVFKTADDNLHMVVESAIYRMHNSAIARYLLRFVAATRPPVVTDEVVEDIAWLRERAFSTEKGGDEEILTRIADRLASCLPRERMNNMAEVTKLKTSADYIEVQQCDLDFEEELRAAYAINGPVVSLIAEFREQCASMPAVVSGR